MRIDLYDHQKEALEKMHNGCILCGGVGSGKSRAALAYYHILNGGTVGENCSEMENPIDLYIITTAKKRDSLEWELDMFPFNLSSDEEQNGYSNKVVVDSWNNLHKYTDVEEAFFIFDEQRVVGYGSWVKSFLKITQKNLWILLSATPGDTWTDYIPVFIANGFYRNKTHFIREHVVYSSFTKFPKVDRYVNTGLLLRHRRDILVDMDFKRGTTPHHIDVIVDYDMVKYKDISKNRWNYETGKPIKNASELCYALRKVVNADSRRLDKVKELVSKRNKVIIFYNFDYELESLRNLDYICFDGCKPEIAEWNGKKHQEIPDCEHWVYLVNYMAGAEGWNCTDTDTIIFYSQNYSYRIVKQSSGRIDRLNTPYKDLYYYHLRSRSNIDSAIFSALRKKKKFNERKFYEQSS